MAADKSLFAPVPLRAMADDLSGLLLRVLICVAAHDRMSLVTDKGQGCRASNDRMTKLVGCDYARLCVSLTELVKRGYLQREKLGRHTVYRLIYTDDDRLLFGNVSTARHVAETQVEAAEHVAAENLRAAENRQKPADNIFPERGGIDSEESGEENSSEDARFAARDARQAGNGSTDSAHLAKFERAFRAGEIPVNGLREWSDWLVEFVENTELGPDYYRAQRLSEDVSWYLEQVAERSA